MRIAALLLLCADVILTESGPGTSIRYVDVNTEYGIVRGTTDTLRMVEDVYDTPNQCNGECKHFKQVSINSFLGIPFAMPPLGQLRFERPQKANRWSGLFYANQTGNLCTQMANDPQISFHLLHGQSTKFSEDCLNLNIYTPKNITGKSYPVMVYFHDGSYNTGGNTAIPGQFLAANDVIIVIPNFRLGIFGFLSTPGGAVKGNMGLWDQLLALQFVKNNIANFGGSSEKVTIFGFGSGGSSVGLHMLSPESQGYFQRAICQSGTDVGPVTINPPESHPENYVYQVATTVNCMRANESDMVECLKGIDSHQLLLADNAKKCTPQFYCEGFAPVVDGSGGFLPEDPLTMRQRQNSSVPLMSGITRDDGSADTALLIPESVRTDGFSYDDFILYLSTRLMGFLWPFGNATAEQREDVRQASIFYYSAWSNLTSHDLNRKSFIQLMTDFVYGSPWDFQVKHNSKHQNTYAYVFGYPTPITAYPQWFGVSHYYEVPYVVCFPCLHINPDVQTTLGITTLIGLENSTCQDFILSNYMMTLFTNFAKCGDPTPGSGVRSPFGRHQTKWDPLNSKDASGVFHVDEGRVYMGGSYNQRNYALFSTYMPYLLKKPLATYMLK